MVSLTARPYLVTYVQQQDFPLWLRTPEILVQSPRRPLASAIQSRMAVSIQPVQLKPETLAAFDAYVLDAEKEMDDTVHVPEAFLWSKADAKRMEQVKAAHVVAEYWGGATVNEPVAIPEGLIHDFIGAVFVPDRSVQQALTLLQDYENHKNVYKPEVIESKLMARSGEDFQVYLRLLKKKIITVVLDTYHDAHYSSPDPKRALCRSHSTQILEVEHAGTTKETKYEPDVGYGFLWRLYSYWRLEQGDGGVFVECRAISLTRDIPPALAWALKPVVRKLPKESLAHTLECTRKALLSVASPGVEECSAGQPQNAG